MIHSPNEKKTNKIFLNNLRYFLRVIFVLIVGVKKNAEYFVPRILITFTNKNFRIFRIFI